MHIDQLRETALINFEVLLNYWKVSYRQILPNEYEILATWRTDTNFGSVRFNTAKGRGADFAARGLQEEDYKALGPGFDKSDFAGFADGETASRGFDIIGLCQRILRKNNTMDAKQALEDSIKQISVSSSIRLATLEAANRRKQENQEKERKKKKLAKDIWESCKYHKIQGSLGEAYLKNRGINVIDENVRFHPNIIYTPTKVKYSALIFRVQLTPTGDLLAIHRVFVEPPGVKAKVNNPKMALAPIRGGAIWFGEPDPFLALTEGPENALSLREMGYPFVACSIYASNFHNITIPKYVKRLYLVPDVDQAGLKALDRAEEIYRKLPLTVDVILVEGFNVDGTVADINDILRGSRNG